jgi:hypothetical protein
MTRTFSTRILTLVAALALSIGASACNSSGLTASGHVTIVANPATAAAATSSFAFTNNTRIDGGGGTTGMCQISRGASGQYGVVIDLYGNAQATGRAARSVTILAQSASAQSGRITADLGGDDFTSAAGACQVNVTTVDEGHGSVALTSTCPLSFGTETATTDVSLALSGCTVM